jgi:acyl-CoA synthetase (AMP-forming)/AMP-acid ligase II
MTNGLSDDNYVLRALELFAEYGDREALIFGEDRMSFEQVRAGTLNLAATLRDRGVRPGMSVAVLIYLPIEGPALQLALHLLGCRVVWLTLGTGTPAMREYLTLTAPDFFIYDPRTQDELGRELASGLSVPVLRLAPDLLADRPQETDVARLVAPGPESVYQTSGTTGAPKALVHGNVCFRQVLDLATGWEADGHPRLRHLTVTPLWWSAGTVATMITMGSGGLTVLQDGWEPAVFLRGVEAYRINYAFMSPPMFYQLLDDPAVSTSDTSSLYMLNVGTAPILTERLREGIAKLGPVVRIAYGLSESPYVTALAGITDDPRHAERLNSCGTPWGDVRLEIRAEDGTVLGPGEVGEVWVASRLNFTGYVGRPELTAQTLVDGWLRTHDVGYRDEEGYLYLVGRDQDMIITGQGSRKIYGRPIEDALTTHPRVRAAAVIGVPDPALVEVVHAYVVPDGEAMPTVEELRRQVTAALPEICAPRSVDFVDSLPLVGLGKIDKKALRTRYAADHA